MSDIKTFVLNRLNVLKKKESLTVIFYLAGLLIVTCVIFYFKTKDIDLKLAYGGVSPSDYVAHILHPGNFLKDWPSGIMNYNATLIMKTYYYAAKFWNVDPLAMVYPYMFIQILLYFISVLFLAQMLFRNRFISFISMTVTSVSYLAGLNLARSGIGYASLLNFPLFYGYANAFSFFSLGFFLRNNFILAFLFLAFTFYCHVALGILIFVFISAYLLSKWSLIRDKNFIIGSFLFIFMAAPFLYNIVAHSAISTGGISLERWLVSTKLFCYHWYPVTLGLFNQDAYIEFFPTLLAGLFFFFSLRYRQGHNEQDKKVIAGFFACVLMTLIGIFFSEIYPVPILIKISFQRASGLITFLGVLYIINYLIHKIFEGSFFKTVLAIFSLMLMFLSRQSLAVLPLLLLVYTDIRKGYFGPFIVKNRDELNVVKLFFFLFLAFVSLIAFLQVIINVFKISGNHPVLFIWDSISKVLWMPFFYFNPLHDPDFFLKGGSLKFQIPDSHYIFFLFCFVVFILCALIWQRSYVNYVKNKVNKFFSVTIAVCVMTFICIMYIIFVISESEYVYWAKDSREIAKAYKEAQLWAKNNTREDALFMPDPAHAYGWRDFSERSSFGNLREWGFSSFAYNSDYAIYQEGLRRIKEFGIDIEKITENDLKTNKLILRGGKINTDIREAYYNMETDKLGSLCKKYGIDYIILDKRFVKKTYDKAKFTLVYDNSYYSIMKCVQ